MLVAVRHDRCFASPGTPSGLMPVSYRRDAGSSRGVRCFAAEPVLGRPEPSGIEARIGPLGVGKVGIEEHECRTWYFSPGRRPCWSGRRPAPASRARRGTRNSPWPPKGGTAALLLSPGGKTGRRPAAGPWRSRPRLGHRCQGQSLDHKAEPAARGPSHGADPGEGRLPAPC